MSDPLAVVPTLDGSRLAALGELILELHRDGVHVVPARFCDWALERLRSSVRFDSCMWGHGHAAPVTIDDVHVVGQPPAMLQNYARVKRHDFFSVACNARPGKAVDLYDVIDRKRFVKSTMYRNHAKRFGMEHALCVSLPEPMFGFVSFISLWRSDFDRPYDAQDRTALALAVPHLVESRRRNTRERLNRASGTDAAAMGGVAIANPTGVLHDCDRTFVDLLVAEWPGWEGPALPKVLAAGVRRSPQGSLVAPKHRFEWAPFEARRMIHARPLRPIDTVTPRERDVARLVLDGLTHKEIAARLGVSPNTARTHMHLLYRRLGVRNKAELARLIGARAPAWSAFEAS